MVVCCGHEQSLIDKNAPIKSYPVRTIHFADGSKVPPSFYLFSLKGVLEGDLYWCMDGAPNYKGFKLGYDSSYYHYKGGHSHEKSGKEAIKIIKKVFGSSDYSL